MSAMSRRRARHSDLTAPLHETSDAQEVRTSGGHRGRRAMGGRPPRVTATAAKSTKRSREEDEGAELANVEGGTLTGHWPRRVKPPAERTSPRKKGFLSSPVHVDVQRLRCAPRARYGEQAPQLVPIARLALPIPNPSQGRICDQIALDFEIPSGSSDAAEKHGLERTIFSRR